MKNETFRLMLDMILGVTLRLLKPLARVRNKSFYASSGTTQRGMPPIEPQDRDWLSRIFFIPYCLPYTPFLSLRCSMFGVK